MDPEGLDGELGQSPVAMIAMLSMERDNNQIFHNDDYDFELRLGASPLTQASSPEQSPEQ